MIRILHRIKYGKTLAGCLLALAVVIGYCTVSWRVRANSASLIRDAERWLRQKDNARARDTLKTLLWFEPRQYRALLITGISLNADRKFAESIAVLERIPETSDQFEQCGIALASSLVHDEQIDRAEAVLQRHLQLFPRSVVACEELVKLNVRLFRQRETIALLMEFWRRGWDDFGALPLLLKLESTPLTAHEAVAPLEATDRKYPNQAMVVLALARVYALLGKTEQAQSRFESALQLKPHDFLTNVTAAEFFFNRGDVNAAQRLLNSESLKGVEDDRLWFLLCRVAEQSGQVPEANSFLQKALTLRPNDEAYVLMQATVLRRLGRIDESRSAALHATELAEIRKRLMILSSQFDREHPSSQLCLDIADHLQRWGHQDQADAWRRVRQLITPAESH